MQDIRLRGCGTALVTPFREGKVDYDCYAALIDRQVEYGVDFLVPLATTGETPTLSAEEKIKLLEITRAHSEGLPLLAGCGSNSVPGTLANIEMLEACGGADAYLVVVPFYNKPTQEGQYQYFKLIAERSPKPIVIYNVPGRTGANMTAATALRLINDCPNIIGTKEASGNYNQVCEIIRGNHRDDFSILSGDDDMTFAFMTAGAHGVISVASNIAPNMVQALTDMVASKAYSEDGSASELHHLLSPLFRACFLESNPIPVKAAMEHLGLMSAEMRLPLTEATEATKQCIAKVVDELDIENFLYI